MPIQILGVTDPDGGQPTITVTRLLQDEPTIFPLQWASHGCTKWAVESCRKYIEAFEDAAGIEHKLEKFAERLMS